MSRRHYFDRFLTKAAGRLIVTEEDTLALSTAWHRAEKRRAVHGFLALLYLVSGAGILLGAIYSVPELLNFGVVGKIVSLISLAVDYLYSDFGGFYSHLLLKAGIAFLAGIGANHLGTRLATWREGHIAVLTRPVYITGAVLHAVAAAYLMMHGVIELYWEELEVASVVFWCVIPLFMTTLSGSRPLFYQLLTGGIIALHSAAYSCGVSGNAMIALDTSIAAILISFARLYSDRNPRMCLNIMYASMIIICFLLYCTGFVWDVPAILDFQGYIKPGAHRPTLLFLIGLSAVTLLTMAVAHFRTQEKKSRGDALLTPLLLFTLAFSYFATALIMDFVPLGYVFDLFQGRFRQSVFSSNAVLALFFSWLLWFLWCLWVLIKSKETGKILLAQIGVAAMLGSIEVRYVELCRNYSFTAGLVMLPIASVIAAVSARILRAWLQDLLPEGGEQSAASGEEMQP